MEMKNNMTNKQLKIIISVLQNKGHCFAFGTINIGGKCNCLIAHFNERNSCMAPDAFKIAKQLIEENEELRIAVMEIFI